MKSQLEIASEARLLELKARRTYDHALSLSPYGLMPDRTVQFLHALPTIRFRQPNPQTQRIARISTLRFVEGTNVGSRFEYAVHEEWIEFGGVVEKADSMDARVLKTTHSAHEALYAGYGATEHQRLAIALAPFEKANQSPVDPANDERVKRVESLLLTSRLSAPDRLRTRADIVDFLHGRLSSQDFILQSIHRQYRRETERMSVNLHHRLSLGQST